MRSHSFQHPMLRLALLAALLLALLPTIGRICTQSSVSYGWTDLCTMSGLQHVQLPDTIDPGHPDSPNAGHDCPYCPLLNALAGLVVLMALLLPQSAAQALLVQWSSRRIVAMFPCGLGSRGPPLLA